MKHQIAVLAAMTLGACGDPMATFPRLSDADISEEASTLSVSVAPDDETEADTSNPVGFFERLLKSRDADTETQPDSDAADARDQPLPPEDYGVTTDLDPENQDKSSFWTLFSKPPAGSETQPTSTDAPAPFGHVDVACDVSKQHIGKQIAQYPEKRPRYVLYDSKPGNAAPRSFYLVGFADGCARRFTASLALFGSVAMHEQLRYGLPSKVQPYSNTDKSYEKLKSRVCGVARKKPCGSKLNKLDSNTVFLSIYQNFGENETWSNLLLHDGRLLAQDTKG